MSTLNLNTALITTPATTEKGFFAWLGARLAQIRLRRETRIALERLSDAQLRDIGISRGEISDIATKL